MAYSSVINCLSTRRSGIITFEREPDLKQRSEVDSINSNDIDAYLGQFSGFYKILDHFTKLFESKYNKNLKKFVQGEFPALIDGQLGSLFHGVIQLAYGYAAGSDQVGQYKLNFVIFQSRSIPDFCSCGLNVSLF